MDLVPHFNAVSLISFCIWPYAWSRNWFEGQMTCASWETILPPFLWLTLMRWQAFVFGLMLAAETGFKCRWHMYLERLYFPLLVAHLNAVSVTSFCIWPYACSRNWFEVQVTFVSWKTMLPPSCGSVEIMSSSLSSYVGSPNGQSVTYDTKNPSLTKMSPFA